MVLDLTSDVVTLTRQLVDIESVSLNERAIADEIEAALRGLAHLEVSRHGHTLVARTDLGRGERVVIAGHIDTVPVNDNLPVTARRAAPARPRHLRHEGRRRGHPAARRDACPSPTATSRFILYEGEEIEAEHNGLFQLSRSAPELMTADFAILMEPSNAVVEAGCQGTLRAEVRTTGERAHSARSWKGVNAIHRAGEILTRLNAYEARQAGDRRA